MSFTALRAHRIAFHNAQQLSKGKSETTPCIPCKGTGTLHLTVSTVGVEGSSMSVLSCVNCEGKGTKNPATALYQHLIGCGCRHRQEPLFVHAPDGIRVFGKETYLCGFCGFVRQFG